MRVVIADDHRIVREGLALMLSGVEDVDLVGEADDGDSLLALLESVSADIVLLDVRMPGMSGLEVLAALRTAAPDLKVIILSMHDDPAYVARAVELGANAYLLKSTGREELVKALRMVAHGKAYIQAELSGALMDRITGASLEEDVPRLSPRMADVLRLVALGYENKQISTELEISEATVKTHLRNLYEHLDVRNRAEAVAVALRLGLIE